MGKARNKERVGFRETYGRSREGQEHKLFNAACDLYFIRTGTYTGGGFNYGQQRRRNK